MHVAKNKSSKQKLKVQSATVKVNGETYHDGDELELEIVEEESSEPSKLTQTQYDQLLASGTVVHPDDEEEDEPTTQEVEEKERLKVSGATADPDASGSKSTSTSKKSSS